MFSDQPNYELAQMTSEQAQMTCEQAHPSDVVGVSAVQVSLQAGQNLMSQQQAQNQLILAGPEILGPLETPRRHPQWCTATHPDRVLG